MKPDQERVKNLLTDTVTLLCRNGLSFQDELRVEGLIGITLDNHEVFLVHLNEKFGPGGVPIPGDTPNSQQSLQKEADVSIVDSPGKSTPPTPSQKSTTSKQSSDKIKIKTEKDSDSPIKSEGRSSCQYDDGSNSSDARVPPLHGTDSQFTGDHGSSSKRRHIKQEPDDPGDGSPSKRRASENPSVPFITGMVANMNNQSNSNQSWSSGGMPADMGGGQGGDGQMGFDALAASAWLGTQGSPAPGPSGQMMSPDQMVGIAKLMLL